MADLTDIDEILKYLYTVGYSHKHIDRIYISLISEYGVSDIKKQVLIKEYKYYYDCQINYQSLDNLLINCGICEKYKENDYDICIIYFPPYEGGEFKLYFHGNVSKFKNIDNLIKHINENHPECIRQEDIKIALK
jgi:hypothetical protein